MFLPQELYQEVLWHIALEDRRDPLALPFQTRTTPKNSTLNGCMLVNHTFAEIARGHVFASISVDPFQDEDSLRWVADILTGELNGRSFVSTMGSAGRLVQSFVIDVRPQNLVQSRVAILTRIVQAVQQSPKLVTLGILNDFSSYYNFATFPPYAGPLVDVLLRLCLLPNLRHLSLSGLKSVPARVAFNPNLESLNMQLVVLDGPIPDGPGRSDSEDAPATTATSQTSLPGLKTLSLSRFGRTLSPPNTSEFFDFSEAFPAYSQPQMPHPERGRTPPLFPHLATLIWTLSRGEFYGAGLMTKFIQEHAPNLKSLKLYATHFYHNFPPAPALRELRQLETWELVVTFPPFRGPPDDIERISGCIDWTTRAVAEASGSSLASLILHLDFFVNHPLDSSTESPMHPWMTHTQSLIDFWSRLGDEIARCSANYVQIHVDVRFKSEERFAPPVIFQKAFRAQTCAKLREVFAPISKAKDSYEYVPHQFGTHYQTLRSTVPF